MREMDDERCILLPFSVGRRRRTFAPLLPWAMPHQASRMRGGTGEANQVWVWLGAVSTPGDDFRPSVIYNKSTACPSFFSSSSRWESVIQMTVSGFDLLMICFLRNVARVLEKSTGTRALRTLTHRLPQVLGPKLVLHRNGAQTTDWQHSANESLCHRSFCGARSGDSQLKYWEKRWNY